jgi:hypothetical protein
MVQAKLGCRVSSPLDAGSKYTNACLMRMVTLRLQSRPMKNVTVRQLLFVVVALKSVYGYLKRTSADPPGPDPLLN